MPRWTEDTIRAGIERYITEKGVMPSATDFDETVYLPSSRQVQRTYGGLVALRARFGYTDLDFTKGNLRSAIAKAGNERGLTVEDYFEPLLIAQFGEPFVHTQKRYYKGSKNRYDFLVYANNYTFGIDVFTTDRKLYIAKNIHHKILRYKNAPPDLDIYFVLAGEDYTSEDIAKARDSIAELRKYPNMIPVYESAFLKLIETFPPLLLPADLQSLDALETRNSVQ